MTTETHLGPIIAGDCEKIVVLSGSRHCTHSDDVARVEEKLKRVEELYLAPTRFCLVHGACRGVDAAGARWAAQRPRWRQKPYPADWSMGRSAGPRRNAQMLGENPPHVAVIVPRKDSVGTLQVRQKVFEWARKRKRFNRLELVLEVMLPDRHEDA